VSILQVAAFLAIAWLWNVRPPRIGYFAVLPALMLSGMMFGAMGLWLSSAIRQLENFAGVMNFVIFPMFFVSSALYPLWRLRESSVPLYRMAVANPFTHSAELIRFALHGELQPVSLAVVVGCTLLFAVMAIRAYNPARVRVAR
jgi:ABC-2 type transport system permease protein